MCEGQSWGFCSSVTELHSSLSETKTQRWIKHMTSLFQCWLFQHLPASMLLFAGVLNTHTPHTRTDQPAVAVNTWIMCIYAPFVCLCVLKSPATDSPPPPHPTPPLSALLLHDITQPGFYSNKRSKRSLPFALPVWNAEQKVLIQPVIQDRGAGNMRGLQCERLRQHQTSVDRKLSQLIIWGNDSLSGWVWFFFSPFWKGTKMKMKRMCTEILSRKGDNSTPSLIFLALFF